MTFKTFALFVLFFSSFAVFSQKDTIHLQSIEITSSKISTLNANATRNIEIINNAKNTPLNSINELLGNASNIDSRQRGSEGVQSDVSIRGGSYDQSLVLLNGIMMNDPQTGHHTMNLPIEIGNIDQIEILNGPGTRIWGMNAFSGAINLCTPSPLNNHVRFSYLLGDFGLNATALSLSGATKNLGTYLSFNQKNCDGFTTNTDFETRQLYFRSKFLGSYFHADVQGGYVEKSFGANSFYSAKYPNQFETIKMYFFSATVSDFKIKNLVLKLYTKDHKDCFELFRDHPPTWYKSHNYHHSISSGMDLNYHFLWAGGKTSLGANFKSEKIYSNVLGDLMNTPIEVDYAAGNFYTRSKYRAHYGVFINQGFSYKKLKIDAGIMGNYYAESSFQLFPGIDISYQPMKAINFMLSYNKSFRLPTFTDLYYSGPTNQGNVNLKPEEAHTIEAGIQYQKNNIQLSLSTFQRWGINMIDWVKQPDAPKWTTMNLTSVNVQGMELSFVYRIDQTNSRFFIKSLGINAAYNNISKQSSGTAISYYVLDGLKEKLTFSLRHAVVKQVFFDWLIHYQDRYGSYVDAKTNIPINYKPFLTIDAKLSYTVDAFHFYVECNNLSNVNYIDFGNIGMPGRWIKGGIIFDLDFNKNNKNE